MESLKNIFRTTKEEHELLLDEMEVFNEGDAPYIGIFWFDPEEVELIDVYKTKESNIRSIKGIKNYSKLHKDIWKKLQFRDKAKGVKNSKYNGDYTLILRGRVRKVGDEYQCLVGDWIDDYRDMLKYLIEGEFNIPNIVFIKDEHWDIGRGWSERGFH